MFPRKVGKMNISGQVYIVSIIRKKRHFYQTPKSPQSGHTFKKKNYLVPFPKTMKFWAFSVSYWFLIKTLLFYNFIWLMLVSKDMIQFEVLTLIGDNCPFFTMNIVTINWVVLKHFSFKHLFYIWQVWTPFQSLNFLAINLCKHSLLNAFVAVPSFDSRILL